MVRQQQTNATTKGDETIYWGKRRCQGVTKAGRKCSNRAYWDTTCHKSRYRCKIHANSSATELPKDPLDKERKAQALREHLVHVHDVAAINTHAGRRGTLKLKQIFMRTAVPLDRGRMHVYPNNRHQNRADGFGCRKLSPMGMGPTECFEQPGVMQALNIENMHQFNKVWCQETIYPDRVVPTIDGVCAVGVYEQPTPSGGFWIRRDAGYADPVPHRHKFGLAERKRVGNANTNVPVYSVFVDKHLRQRRFTYVQSRYFYSCEYERLAEKTEELEDLRRNLRTGYDLTICGYDAYPIEGDCLDPDVLYRHYCDEKESFGHERVLLTLLALKDPHDYPWHRYRREHPEAYEGIVLLPDPSRAVEGK